MSHKLKFIHAADLHLGCAFKGIYEVSPHVAQALREATYRAYNSIIDHAVAQRVDFVLFAGDIYNQNENSLVPQLRFQEGLQRLDDAGIPSFVIHGNHDPFDPTHRASWPSSCHRFPACASDSVVVTKADVPVAVVAGISYERRDVSENLSLQYRHDHPELYSIAMLHTNCGNNAQFANYAPSTLPGLCSLGFDYWALGHIHSHMILSAQNPTVVYPGSPQGLNPTEVSEHGFCLVEVDPDKTATVSFVPSGPIIWHQATIDGSQWRNENDVFGSLESVVEEARTTFPAKSILLRITVQGRSSLHSWLESTDIRAELLTRARSHGEGDPFCWIDRIKFDLGPPLDLEARAQGLDITGEILRQAKAVAIDENACSEAEGKLTELFGHRTAKSILGTVEPHQIHKWLESAATLLADSLTVREELS